MARNSGQKPDNNIQNIIKMIQGMSPEEQAALIEDLAGESKDNGKKKIRRKHYKKGESRGGNQTKKSNNAFEDSDLLNAHKDDVEIDRKLWGKNSIEPRDYRPKNNVDIECTRCNKTYSVNPNTIFKMPNGEYSFVCDKCLNNNRRISER